MPVLAAQLVHNKVVGGKCILILAREPNCHFFSHYVVHSSLIYIALKNQFASSFAALC